MGWIDPLDFHEKYTVTVCRNPDYCQHCNKMIKNGQIKVAWRGRIFHKGCIEQRADGAIKVNTQTMKVERHEPDS